jgi:hypothetical protein
MSELPEGIGKYAGDFTRQANRSWHPFGSLAIHPFPSGWTHGFAPHPYEWFAFVTECGILVNRHGQCGGDEQH